MLNIKIILKLTFALKKFLRAHQEKVVRIYLVFVVDFWKDGLMLEETNSILHQRTQNCWIEKSAYTFMLLPEHMKQITKCSSLQIYMVVGNAENLDLGLCLCICVCVFVCLFVSVCCALRCSAFSLPGLFGRFGHGSE
jgi:hypothetical protein